MKQLYFGLNFLINVWEEIGDTFLKLLFQFYWLVWLCEQLLISRRISLQKLLHSDFLFSNVVGGFVICDLCISKILTMALLLVIWYYSQYPNSGCWLTIRETDFQCALFAVSTWKCGNVQVHWLINRTYWSSLWNQCITSNYSLFPPYWNLKFIISCSPRAVPKWLTHSCIITSVLYQSVFKKFKKVQCGFIHTKTL